MKQETLDKLHAVQLDMLDLIDGFCEKNNLSYYLAYGTLLGAVRHNGFIPWDDDVDIIMPRKDYEYLEEHISETMGEKYFFQSSYTDKHYGRSFSKIRINNTIFLEDDDSNVEGRHHGIFIDIFVMEDCGSTETGFFAIKRKIYKIIDSYIVLKRSNMTVPMNKKFFGILPIDILIKLRELLKKGRGSNYYVEYLGITSKEAFEPAKTLSFEGKSYKVPNKYDEILTGIYGDYMQLPPIEKRVTHNPVRISLNTEEADEQI